MDRCFQGCKLSLSFLKILSLDCESQISFLLYSLSSLYDFFFNDIIIDLSELIEGISSIRKQYILPKRHHVLILIIDRNLKVTIQRIKELTVSLKDSYLLILCGSCIVYVLKLITLGKMILRNLKYSIFSYCHYLYCFLYRLRTSVERLTGLLQFLKAILKYSHFIFPPVNAHLIHPWVYYL